MNAATHNRATERSPLARKTWGCFAPIDTANHCQLRASLSLRPEWSEPVPALMVQQP